MRARRPQAVQQEGHATRVVEGDVGGGPAGQRGSLVMRARLPQTAEQEGYAVRAVERGVGGRVPGQQRGGLVGTVRLLSPSTCDCVESGQRLVPSARPAAAGARGDRALGCQLWFRSVPSGG